MHQGPHHGLQRPRHGQDYGHEVEQHGEAEIALDGEHHAPGEAQEVRQLAQLIAHQGDVRGVHGDVAAYAAHGYAHAGPLEGRGVVYAVAYHGSCLEGLACGPAIESRWGRSPAELADCEAVWALEAYYLGQALCSYIYTISPERIVLGGGVMNQQQLLPLIRAEVNRQLGGYIKGKGLNDLDSYIVSSSLGGRQGIMGCLRLAADALEEVQHGS